MSLSMGSLLHRKPLSIGTSHNSCGAQGHDKRDAFFTFDVRSWQVRLHAKADLCCLFSKHAVSSKSFL